MKRFFLFFAAMMLSLPWLLSIGVSQSSPEPSSSLAPPSLQPTDGIAYEAIAAGLGGFLAWMLTKTIGFLVLRKRLISYAVVVVNSHLRQYVDHEQWLKATREKTIREGYVIKLAASYTIDELEDLTELRPDGLRLLRQHEILRVTALLHRLKELESLMAGFCDKLEEYKVNRVPLEASDVDYLQRKQDRILSYMLIIPKKIASLDELPLDYQGLIGSSTMVTGSSAVLPPGESPPPKALKDT